MNGEFNCYIGTQCPNVTSQIPMEFLRKPILDLRKTLGYLGEVTDTLQQVSYGTMSILDDSTLVVNCLRLQEELSEIVQQINAQTKEGN